MFTSCIPALIQHIDDNKNRIENEEILERFPDKVSKKCTIVAGIELKRDVILYDLSKHSFEQ